MPYTTLAKVKSMFRGITISADTGNESTNTAVTEEDVAEFIAEADAEIDARLNRYYVTPITGTEALKVVGTISKYKVAHMIKTILEATSSNSDKEQDVQTNLEKKANRLLEDITPTFKSVGSGGTWIEPVIDLVDATRKPSSPRDASVFGTNYAGVRTPTITRGGNNW